MKQLLSSPSPPEDYKVHIERCKEKLNLVFAIFEPTIKRIFGINDGKILKSTTLDMITFHDLGKLTRKWQENVGTSYKLPSHAPIGAGYLYKKFAKKEISEDLKNAICFAVAIHHTDKGLLAENIEKPDVQAILEGLTDEYGKIKWANEAKTLGNEYFDSLAENLTVYDLKEMARGLRIWARGDSLLNQHKKRLQASIMHHILKLCDISAASERKEFQEDKEENYFGGWLMSKNIIEYMNKIEKRIKS